MAGPFTAGNSFAQTKTDTTMMKDCCMMKDEAFNMGERIKLINYSDGLVSNNTINEI
jgi:hypothetical protein